MFPAVQGLFGSHCLKLRAKQLALLQLSLAWLNAHPFEKSQAIKLSTSPQSMFELSVPLGGEGWVLCLRGQRAASSCQAEGQAQHQLAMSARAGSGQDHARDHVTTQRISVAPYRVQLLTILITQGTSFVFTSNIQIIAMSRDTQFYQATAANMKGNAPGIYDMEAGETEGCGNLWHQGLSTGVTCDSCPTIQNHWEVSGLCVRLIEKYWTNGYYSVRWSELKSSKKSHQHS